MTRKISIGLVITCFLVMGIWDIYPALTPEKGDTISEATRDGSAMWYILPFVVGIVVGHFFLNRTNRETRNISALWIATGAFLGRDLLQVGTFPGGNAVSLLAGLAAGSVWWPQAPMEETDDSNLQE